MNVYGLGWSDTLKQDGHNLAYLISALEIETNSQPFLHFTSKHLITCSKSCLLQGFIESQIADVP